MSATVNLEPPRQCYALDVVQAIASHPSVGDFSSLLEWIRRALSSPHEISASERQRLSDLREQASTLGAPVLQAQTREMLEDKVRELSTTFGLFECMRDAPTPVGSESESESPSTFDALPEDIVACLGEGPTRRLMADLPLAHAIVTAAQTLKIPTSSRSTKEDYDELLAFFRDTYTHSVLKRCVLNVLESMVVGLAIVHAFFTRDRLDSWKALALVEINHRGLYDQVRLLLVLSPDMAVSEALVPMHERLDMVALDGEVNAANERWNAMVNEAVRRDG